MNKPVLLYISLSLTLASIGPVACTAAEPEATGFESPAISSANGDYTPCLDGNERYYEGLIDVSARFSPRINHDTTPKIFRDLDEASFLNEKIFDNIRRSGMGGVELYFAHVDIEKLLKDVPREERAERRVVLNHRLISLFRQIKDLYEYDNDNGFLFIDANCRLIPIDPSTGRPFFH